MNVLVVPTIREKCIIEFIEAWEMSEHWDEVVVIEDNPEKSFDVNLRHHYSWKEIEETLGEQAWIISRRDSSIRSFGFLMAYRLGAKFIFTLDDDCYPSRSKGLHESYLVAEHIKNLTETPRWVPSVPGQRTRGLPYKNFGKAQNVMLSVGLWEGTPDFDAIQTLSGQSQELNLPETRVMPIGQYFPICGMNLAFRREFTPLTYFMLQGDGYPYRRFDDIWFGVVAKKICDHLGWMITCGKPYVCHTKASDPFVNLVKEAPGVKHNEHFWELIDSIPLTKRTPADCMSEIGAYLETQDDEYHKRLGLAIRTWAGLYSPIV